MALPTFYVPHGGGPCFFMDWDPPDAWTKMADFLRGLDGRLTEKPRALLVVSAHWEERVPTVTTAAAPPLYYDYGGFPPHTYELKWPSPGSPELAARVQGLLSAAGIESAGDGARGFDHGVFIPFKLSYPDGLPTVQLSLQAGLDPEKHLQIGRALAPLRDEGVLILGSGMSYHNMRALRGGSGGLEDSQKFDAWLAQSVSSPEKLVAWKSAPGARAAHPREEHLIPVLVAAGAGGAGKIIFRDQVLGVVVSAAQFG
jgi:aromatic ring-opening dioxygenase catalytic subunit (LigB family)